QSLTITVKQIHSESPVINEFTASNYNEKNGKDHYLVEMGKTFMLNWNVENASGIELYKNGISYIKINSGEENIELKEETYDDAEKEIEYTLLASNGSVSIKSKPLVVKFIYLHPVINEFTASKYIVRRKKPFQLKWAVENVSNLELLKNGVPYKTLDPAEKYIKLTEEVYNGKETEIEYTLVASNSLAEIKSSPVVISVRPRKPLPQVIKRIMLAVLVLGLLLGLYYYWPHPVPLQVAVYPFSLNQITEGDTITI